MLKPLLLISLWWVGVGQSGQDPLPDLKELVRLSLTGDGVATEKLVTRGASVIPKTKGYFGSETPKFEAFARRVMESELERSQREAPGLRFHGQFEHLRVGGPDGASALLGVFLDDDVPIRRRRSAGYALGDVGTSALLPTLEEVADDFLIEGWLEREVVYLMARLGDRRRVDKWIAAGQRVADRELTNQTLALILGAHTELGEIFYRIRDYERAVGHYQKKLVLLRDLSERVAEELLPAIRDEIALVRYNLSCSLCLSGDIAQSFVQLESALANDTVTLEMVLHDGDLSKLRNDARFPKWIEEQRSAKKKASADSARPEGGKAKSTGT